MTAPRPSPKALAALLATTPARLAIGRTGPRLPVKEYLRFLGDHARARDAVFTEVPPALVRRLGLTEIATRATTRAEYLHEPARGRVLAPSARAKLARCRQRPAVQLIVTDGLSSVTISCTSRPAGACWRRVRAPNWRVAASVPRCS